MLELLWLVPTIPFAGFLLLILFGRVFGRRISSGIGAGSIGLSALFAFITAAGFLQLPAGSTTFTQNLWTWFSTGSIGIEFALHLDPLSFLMMLVVTFVGFLIHFYSMSFMADDDSVSRFFAYMNLFVGFMLILVLGNNLLSLLVGWEGVGLCSYLLIGFWYQEPANGHAARKAFIVTRIGDLALLIALFILFFTFGTLNIEKILAAAPGQWAIGSAGAGLVAILLLGGAVGKSAQLPLQTWLPDAMAGPTPVSALIHAATMVTAGVYLIARMHAVFDLAPAIQAVVAIVGAATLLLAGLAALGQNDIKRVLAYSTISQIGYMFLALGVGAYSAAMFHFMTHAFFKALLFLGAGVVILAMHHEHNMYKMGGLKKLLPVTFWTFLIASASLSAVPLVTAGFYSKDNILWAAWTSSLGSPLLWLAGLVGALLTSLYTFRMVFLTFYGDETKEVEHKPSWVMLFPLVTLATLSTIGGFINMPEVLGGFRPLAHFLNRLLPAASEHGSMGTELLFLTISGLVSLGGIYIAYVWFIRRREQAETADYYPWSPGLFAFFRSGLGFDWLYHHIIVLPYQWVARTNRDDYIDLIYTGMAAIVRISSQLTSMLQTGRIRSYAFGISLGAVVITIIMVLS